jgi:hypothetical protein
MSDPTPNHSLSEISHLFLSAVRDRTTGGTARPVRTPPPKQPINISIDLTPEEFAEVFAAGDDEEATPASSEHAAPVGKITAIIGGHLNGKQFERAKDYARRLASDGTRIGLIELDTSDFRVMCFDRFGDVAEDGAAAPVETFDPRQMNEVLDELSWDVQRWLLVLPQARVPEARQILRLAPHWTLLSTCDHDGVIACYRTLKGLTDLWPAEKNDSKPRLSLALLDAADEEQAERVSAKLVSVCQQFLNWPLEAEPHVEAGAVVREHLVMSCRPIHDKGQLATAPQWGIVAEFIERSKRSQSEDESVVQRVADVEEAIAKTQAAADAVREVLQEPHDQTRQVDMSMTTPENAPAILAEPRPSTDDVIDLPAPEAGESGIVEAILKHCSGELVECPIAPPMCPRAKLAVSRDRRIVMLAVSREGLADLHTIGQAYQWLQQNQNLIGMAVPQLSIDPQQPPHLSLLVNQSDSTAQTLQPMLEGAHVTVKTYRKLRWGGKTGLLLEAA